MFCFFFIIKGILLFGINFLYCIPGEMRNLQFKTRLQFLIFLCNNTRITKNTNGIKICTLYWYLVKKKRYSTHL